MGKKGNHLELIRWLNPVYIAPFDPSQATLGTRLRYLRRKACVTIAQLATLSGISHNSISRLERASASRTNPVILEKILQVLGVKFQQICPDTPGDCYDLLIPPKTLGSRLKNARMKKGLQQKELARTLGVSRETIRRWEGDQVRPGSKVQAKLTELLGLAGQGSVSQSHNETAGIWAVDSGLPLTSAGPSLL